VADSAAQCAGLSRRDFLQATALAAGAALAGCAVNPVTGEQQLMLLGQGDEIAIDRANAPHQLSSDYGVSQDARLAAYLDGFGRRMAAQTHRPSMPYRFVPVNAVYVNAYAFPGGTVAATRGILLSIGSEDALAALFGHELGHVNARHTASRMSTGILVSLALAGATSVAGQRYADLAAGLGGIASGALLAHYSRDDERQADELSLEYLRRAGYHPAGLLELMDVLRTLEREKPSALEQMFASHPMSEERYRTAERRIRGLPAAGPPPAQSRERYLDETAALRRDAAAIQRLQEAERLLVAKKPDRAAESAGAALQEARADYAGLLIMAKCQLALDRHAEAERHALAAAAAYPGEAQAHHVTGVARLGLRRYEAALAEFNAYERLLSGNPFTGFFQGRSYEGMGRRSQAAERYASFLKQVDRGEEAKYAAQRLREWGMLPQK
jgi:predicted Zn-dependent protease